MEGPATFYDKKRVKVGEGDENTREMVNFLRIGMSSEEIARLEAEAEAAERIREEKLRRAYQEGRLILDNLLAGCGGEREVDVTELITPRIVDGETEE